MDLRGEITRQVPGQSDVVVHEGAVESPRALQLDVTAIKITHIAAMLTVHTHRHPGGPGRHLRFQGGQVPTVDNLRAHAPEYLVQLGILPQALPRRLVQRDKLDVVALDALAEVGHFGHGQDGVPIGSSWHVIHQVHDAILEATRVKTVHHMADQRP